MDVKSQVKICGNKIESIENDIEKLTSKVDDFDAIKEVLVELKLLTFQQVEANEKRDAMLRDHGIALAKTMDSLQRIDEKSDRHEAMLESLSHNDSLSLSEIGKSILMMTIGAVVTAILSGVII